MPMRPKEKSRLKTRERRAVLAKSLFNCSLCSEVIVLISDRAMGRVRMGKRMNQSASRKMSMITGIR